MEIKQVFVKKRSEFGKQCIFDDSEVTVEENIFPNRDFMKDYVNMNPVHRAVQISKQFAVHEVQTESTVTKESGMNHLEGGWPKEINFTDEEIVTRYRRRVEKDDNWAPKIRQLAKPMEHCILQNNAVNIYDNYFDDMIPTELVLPLGIRTVNAFKDPLTSRPITHLSWSPDHGNRLAASYCFTEFQRVSSDLSSSSYIWDIENPNVAFMSLKAADSLVTIEFNPNDPSMLISGLMSGQVCNWDIRTSDTPIFISHSQYSHKNPANCVLWINSKTNTEFFSASTDGTINWWDIRMLRKPTEILIMDLENPIRGDMLKAVGVSALQFESTIGTKFMAGMENGIVVSGTRKGKNPSEKMSMRFDCHCGPVVAIDRNPFSTKNFLTIGDWTTKIWAEDTKEGNLISTTHHGSIPAGGCWSTSRYSVFYVINNDGMIQVFDVLVGIKDPVLTSRVCKENLTAIAPHQQGKFIAVGNSIGNIFMLESSQALTTNAPNDKNLMSMYLERCSRYEKAVDNRLKETRLMQRVTYSESESTVPSLKAKVKGKSLSRKSQKDKKIDDKRKSDRDKKKLRMKRTKDTWQVGDTTLADDEKRYFETLEKEIEKYTEAKAFVESDKPIEGSSVFSIKESSIKRGKHDDLNGDRERGSRKSEVGKQRSSKRRSVKDKKTTGRFSKMKDIIIVKKKSDMTEGEKTDGKLTEEILDEIEKIEIIGDELSENEKYLEQTTSDEDDKDLGVGGSRGKKIIIKNKKNNTKSREKRKTFLKPKKKFKTLQPCDQEICDPICSDFIPASTNSEGEYEDIDDDNDSLLKLEESKINALIEEMHAGLPKNILPSKVENIRRNKEEKKLIMIENNASPVVLNKELKKIYKKKIRDEIVTGLKEVIKIPIVQKSVNFKDKEEENVEENEKKPNESEPQSIDEDKIIESNIEKKCKIYGSKPMAVSFGNDILGTIGAKMKIDPGKKCGSSESKITKKNDYPRISSINITKQ